MDSTASVQVSFFDNETDTVPRRLSCTVAELFNLLTTHQERRHKRRGALWSPFLFDGNRKGENLIESTLLAFDIDDGTSPEQVEDWLQGLTYCVSSTHSSTPDHWKLRVGIMLTEPIPATDFSSVWHAAVETLLRGHVDGSTHDLARMFYLPTCPPGTTPYVEIEWGEPLDWRTLPKWVAPEKPPLLDLDGIEGLDAGVERRRAQAMLQKWCLDVANSVAGLRHETILRLGRAAGGLVGSGTLAYEEAYAEFLDAAEACGEVADHGMRDVHRAISAALENGMAEPWTPAQLGDSDDWLNAPRVKGLKKLFPVPGIGMGTAEQLDSSRTRSPVGTSPPPDPIKWRNHRQTVDLLPPNIDWLIDGILGRGLITELVAKVKMGKTTFMLQGLRAGIAGDEVYCGRAVRPFRVAYVTEEGWQTFQLAMRRYGLNDLIDNDAFFTVFDFETEEVNPKKPNLPFVIDSLIAHAAEDKVDAIILDTLSIIAGLDEEDHSGKAAGVMAEVRRLTTGGLAVGILRHSRKSGGDVGDAGRGSSAISGYCDILLQIEPFKGDEDTTSARVLRSKSRLGVDEPLMLEFDKETERYSSAGPAQSGQERLDSSVKEALADLRATSEATGKTSSEVTVRSGKRKQAVTATLKDLVARGEVAKAPRGQSIVYWLPQVIHLGSKDPEKGAVAVPRVPAPTRTRSPVGTEPGCSAVPIPIEGKAEQVGTAKRSKTPEQVAKAAAEKAAKEQARLDAADEAAPTLDYKVVTNEDELREALAKLSTVSVSLDTETTGLNAHRDTLRTIQLSDGETNVVIDTWACRDLSAFQAFLTALQSYLDGVSIVSMHTYLFDLAFLQQVGISIDPNKIYDVRTAAMVLESKEDWTDYRLQGIAKRHLHQHVNKAEQKSGWDTTVLRHAKLAYAAEDARVTHAAGEALRAKLAQDADVDGLWTCLALERDVQAATWWLASAGVPADRTVMSDAVWQQEKAVAERLEALNAEVGRDDVNWLSPKQVLPVLQARGLDLESTGEDALMDADTDDPLVDVLLDYRSARSCLGLLRKAQSSIAADGRIYASFNPIGAQTGRTSCSDPNLQNLPHETLARSAIRPGPGRVFVRADYSQLQLVIAAWHANDTEMLRVLNEPKGDIHQRTADAVGCSRRQAKAVNFGFLFGAYPKTFRREQRKNGIFLTLAEAARYRDTFMRTYRGIRSWHKGLGEWGDVVTVIDPSGSGRRRTAVRSNNVKANTPVQMVEAHGFKLALQALYSSRGEVPSARLVMMVHDELIAECDEQDADAVSAWLAEGMREPMQSLMDGVTVRVDTNIVKSYADEDKQ